MEEAIFTTTAAIAAAVLGWGAKNALGANAQTWIDLRPLMLVSFATIVFVGLGILIGQMFPKTQSGWVFVAIGGGGVVAVLLINIAADHLKQKRCERRQKQVDDKQDLDPS